MAKSEHYQIIHFIVKLSWLKTKLPVSFQPAKPIYSLDNCLYITQYSKIPYFLGHSVAHLSDEINC